MLRVYTLAQCSTCRVATAWLRARGIQFEEFAIRDTPPTRAELEAMLRHQQGKISLLFNTSGQDYRAAGLKEKLPGMGRDEALALLASNGRLVRRPFVVGAGIGLVGFKEAAWTRALMQ